MRRVQLRQHRNAAATDTVYKSLVESVSARGETELGAHANGLCLMLCVSFFHGTC